MAASSPVPPRSSYRRSRVVVAVLAIGLLALAGCGGGSNKSSSRAGGGAVGAQAARPSAGGAARGEKAAAPGAAGAAVPSKPRLQQRAIVRTATVNVRTKHVDATADAITGMAAPAGGRVDGDDRTSTGRTRTATLVLRVPPATLDGVITRIDRLGTETSRSVRGEDVTASRADIAARTAALQTSVNRLRGFLSHSGSIKDLVALEGQLTERESELESMQAQQRALADQIALATLTVHLSVYPKPVPAKPKPTEPGIASAFAAGWHALARTAWWVVKLLGYSLPITAAVLLLAAGATALWRRTRRPAKPRATSA